MRRTYQDFLPLFFRLPGSVFPSSEGKMLKLFDFRCRFFKLKHKERCKYRAEGGCPPMGLQSKCGCPEGERQKCSCDNGTGCPAVYRDNFLECLRRFSSGLRRHLGEIEKEMLSSARANFPGMSIKAKDRQARFNTVWKPEFDHLFKGLSDFDKDLERKPSLCVMGRRGAGKTTLLMSWLGTTEDQTGLPVLKRLPYGAEDTTACLVRLSASKGSLEETVLDLSLLPKDVMPKVEHRPFRPEGDFFRVTAEGHDKKPYRLCRFPLSGKDDSLYIKKNGENYVVAEDGDISLESLQWHAREVRIPLDISQPGAGRAKDVFSEVDLVDSPGADTTYQGFFGEWKKNKNSEVFKVAVDEIDMLLLVISSNVSAINLGAQFQEDIWWPWCARCGGKGEGRLMIVFSHATEILKPAVRKLKHEDDEDDEARNDSFGRMLYKNVFLPLFAKENDEKNEVSILTADDISTWPPFFFYDKDCDWLLERFKGDFAPGSGEEKSVRLTGILEGMGSREGLSDAEKCVLDLAAQCDDILYENPGLDTLPLKRWVIRTLCSLFDPADRGLGLLTRCVVEYGSRGPAAKNHAAERMERAVLLHDSYFSFFFLLAEPNTNIDALNALKEASSEMNRLWKSKPTGPKLRIGRYSESLVNKAELNLRPGQQKKDFFERDEILSAAVNDALSCDDLRDRERTENTTNALRRVLVRCLSSDFAISRHFEKKKDLLWQYPHELQTFFSAVMERAPRIMEHLTNASEEQLNEIATGCFEMDIVNTALLTPVLQASLERERPENTACLNEAGAALDVLNAFLEKNPIHLPFSGPDVENDGTGARNPLQEEEVRPS